VLTGFPNYPDGELYPGYKIRPRTVERSGAMTVQRVALYPDHGTSVVRRLANYGSFAVSATVLGLPGMRGLDALWVYNSPATVALPMWALRHVGHVPTVLHNMDMWPDSLFATGFVGRGRGTRFVEKGLDAWCRQMYASAAFVAYVSPSAGEVLRRRGVPAEKLHYVPVWVNEEIFRPQDGGPVRKSLGIRDDELVVLYAGALGRAQGIGSLVDAMNTLPRGIPARCLIAGSGTESEAVRAAAGESDGRVQFLGTISSDHIGGYMAAADIHFVGLRPDQMSAFTLPSKVQATMATGKALLTAAEGDATRVTLDADAGFIASPGDARSIAEALIGAQSLGREALAVKGENARRYFERHFSARRGVHEVESLLIAAATEGRQARTGR
jgi:glycosyltransferase involved in cell wall biosynthesis